MSAESVVLVVFVVVVRFVLLVLTHFVLYLLRVGVFLQMLNLDPVMVDPGGNGAGAVVGALVSV